MVLLWYNWCVVKKTYFLNWSSNLQLYLKIHPVLSCFTYIDISVGSFLEEGKIAFASWNKASELVTGLVLDTLSPELFASCVMLSRACHCLHRVFPRFISSTVLWFPARFPSAVSCFPAVPNGCIIFYRVCLWDGR